MSVHKQTQPSIWFFKGRPDFACSLRMESAVITTVVAVIINWKTGVIAVEYYMRWKKGLPVELLGPAPKTFVGH